MHEKELRGVFWNTSCNGTNRAVCFCFLVSSVFVSVFDSVFDSVFVSVSDSVLLLQVSTCFLFMVTIDVRRFSTTSPTSSLESFEL